MANFNDFFDIPQNSIDIEKLKFIDNMNMLKNMSVQEFTLYKKHKEVNFNFVHKSDISRIVKAKIWTPADIYNKSGTIAELEQLDPVIEFVPQGSPSEEHWNILRIFSHTMQFDQNPGRFLRFIVYDRNTGKYLGATSLGSDVITITARDNWIGWTKEDKLQLGKLTNSTIGTCIMATQPFGYNFLGGKLVASLLATKVVSDTWKSMYGDTLVGITTTSLYGSESMYNSIPFWKKLGSSSGKITIKPDDDIYEWWHHWLKENRPQEYSEKTSQKEGVSGPTTNIKQKIITLIFKEIGLKMSQYDHGFIRGVYYAPLYENTRDFLCNRISEDKLIPLLKLTGDRDAVLNWWRLKATKRYETLFDENRLKPEILFYNQMINRSWNESREMYLSEVGR